ncbi:hypothetical protein A2851_05030 [Candidatus Kaiserbacteria bacterium RIFCSPHIGHO2_01_FULL_53_29]|uniref:Uncharacterized protein n=1 Tax=Candidatus Kaiserbacteria bacterium RIFCSPHIGHO2_01_FULL_53_29 TaxID=1798480 RepID=A0A1F6CTC2_9BACT|nr:MAG: hypothetical protein A2851_05030 [Candidatus Kaiserbacteria bacterium RIFCSPHIGHO2_01_FULL_53_29]
MTDEALTDIEHAIEKATPDQQRRFLARLPHVLHLAPDQYARMKAAEPSFAFWNNAADAVYDNL